MRVAVVLAVSVVVAACSSFGTDQQAATTPDASAPDAETGSPECCSSPSEAGVTDDGATMPTDGGDGGADAGERTYGIPVGTSCASLGFTPKLCFDFDTAQPQGAIQLNHTSTQLVGVPTNKALAIDTMTATVIGSDSAYAYYTDSFLTSPFTMHWSFDVLLKPSVASLITFTQLGNSENCHFQPNFAGQTVGITEVCNSTDNGNFLTVPVAPNNDWWNIAIDVDFAAQDVTLTATDSQGNKTSNHATGPLPFHTGGLFFELGLTYASKVFASQEIQFDNFVVDY